MSSTYTATWLMSSGSPLEVNEAPNTIPGPNEVLVKNGAVAINPVDWAVQDRGALMFPHLKFPLILGEDCAGTVVSVGSSITHFKPGDRVLGHATGALSNNSSHAAFQSHVLVSSNLVAKIPSSLPFTSACVLPLSVSTAACGLFQKDFLGLQYPSIQPKPTGQVLLVWGGSTSIGCNAIQLAVAAGYEVISTASPKNFKFVKELGASEVFDYNSPSVEEDLIKSIKAGSKPLAGAFNVSHTSSSNATSAFDVCSAVIVAINGTAGGFVATAMHPPPGQVMLEGISSKMIFGNSLQGNEVGALVYEGFLEKALANGTYKAVPEALVAGKGLEGIQAAMQVQKEGVSARKVVVDLE